MTAPTPAPPDTRYKLLSAVIGLATVALGVFSIVYDDKITGTGIVAAGLGITTHSLS